MKKSILILGTALVLSVLATAQDKGQLKPIVAKLENASTATQYEQLANEFEQLATNQKTNWLAWYYAAFCNAKTGWLLQDDPDNIEPFADKADEQIAKARALLDTSTQKNELSEIYCVLSMLNRARVFINPSTYGRQYGPKAGQYVKLAQAVNADNPRALYIAGWEKFATPKAWGGDKAKAKELLEKAKQLLQHNQGSSIDPHWGSKEVEALLKQL